MEVFTEWVPFSYSLQYQVSAAVYFDEIFAKSVRKVCQALKESLVIFLNGDHFSTLFTVKHFKNFKPDINRFALVWIDSHVDLNLPYESPSGNLHGMTVRHLVGEGYSQLVNGCLVEVNDLYFVGGFELDPGERNFLNQRKLKLFTPEELSQLKLDLPVFVSFDFDIIRGFNAVNTETTIACELDYLLSNLKKFISNNNVVGIDFNEYNGFKDSKLDCFRKAVSVISEIVSVI